MLSLDQLFLLHHFLILDPYNHARVMRIVTLSGNIIAAERMKADSEDHVAASYGTKMHQIVQEHDIELVLSRFEEEVRSKP